MLWRRSPLLISEPFSSLGLSPKLLHFIETGAFGGLAGFGQAILDMREAPFKFSVGAAQGGLGIDLEVARKICARE